jgi:DNA repair protein RecO (recombination protein O)
MPESKTLGIILKSTNWSDSSKILHVFTEKFGKISLVAKGAKNPKSSFRGVTEVFQYSEFVFNKKENSHIFTLKDVSLIENFPIFFSGKLKSFYFSLSVLEILDKKFLAEENHHDFFQILVERFFSLKKEENAESFYLSTLYSIMTELGIGIETGFCNECGTKLEKSFQFTFQHGFLCENCLKEHLETKMLPNVYKLLNYFSMSSAEKIAQIQITKETFENSLDFLINYIEFHSDENFPRKALNIALKME